MCLTLRNAVIVLDHQDGRSPALGYTRTRHHVGHLGPGDWWFPGSDPLPHTVTGAHRRDGRIVLTDQYGFSYSHPGDAVVSTAVPDPRILMPQTLSGRRDESVRGTRDATPLEPQIGMLGAEPTGANRNGAGNAEVMGEYTADAGADHQSA